MGLIFGWLSTEHYMRDIFLMTSVAAIVATLMSIRFYLRITAGRCFTETKMEGKTVIITGANSGIGKETAKDLAGRGARIIMACRNLETANAVKDEIVKETKNNKILVKKLDLGSQKSVHHQGPAPRRLSIWPHPMRWPNVSGKYFMDCKEATLNAAALDEEKGLKIWEESVKIVKLTPQDPKI
ncbi:GM18707 [Drosophila sechellia]|uniref:GM18707 n=1 Tax=Drosophila sechellia TaxID=7238 RepID=B4I293_DROSE|nr:GM18707 [Drosophila sechellia]